jgi:hypothetical protein
MDKIITFTNEQLDQLLLDAVGLRSRAEWRATIYRQVAAILKQRPRAYRTFGPWWWPLKAQLVAAGALEGEVDPDLSAPVTTGNADRDLVGALAYHGWNVDNMVGGNTFQVETAAGDTVDYLLVDPEFEPAASGRPA